MPRYKKKNRYRKKKKSPAKIIAVVVVLAILIAGFVVFAMPQNLYRLNGDADAEQSTPETGTSSALQSDAVSEPEENQVSENEAETEGSLAFESTNGEPVAFPVPLEDGSLEIESLFQFSGINVDCENQEGDNIASVTISNTSSAYLKNAEIGMLLQDGTELYFTVTDLPAGKSAMAFSTENTAIEADAVCVDITCEAVFEEPDAAAAEKVSATVEGTQITLVNNTGEDLSEIVVYCRCLFDESYFGGVTYHYTINDLPAGGSTTVDAVDCLFGEAEVVSIAVNDHE